MSENLIRCYNNYLVTNPKTDLTFMTSYPLYGYNLKKLKKFFLKIFLAINRLHIQIENKT